MRRNFRKCSSLFVLLALIIVWAMGPRFTAEAQRTLRQRRGEEEKEEKPLFLSARHQRSLRLCGDVVETMIKTSALHSRPSAQTNSLGYSGVFDGLTVGVDSGNKTISGYFFDQTGWDETTRSATFTCAFYLQGNFQDDKYIITTWYPGESESIKGQLKFVTVDGQTNVEIKLDREHGGCGNVHPFTAEGGGGRLAETKRGDWFAVRVVSAKRAYFYSRPSLKARKKQYLVSYNPIRIFQVKNNWVEAEFEAEKITRGWIKMSDLFPAEARKSRK